MQEINGVQASSLDLTTVFDEQIQKQTIHLLINTLQEVLESILNCAEQCDDHSGTSELLDIARKVTKTLADIAKR